MSNFTPAEIESFKSQRLGRLATVNAAGEPHVVPVSFRYNAELDTIDIGGLNITQSKKFRDVACPPGSLAGSRYADVQKLSPPAVRRSCRVLCQRSSAFSPSVSFPGVLKAKPITRIAGQSDDVVTKKHLEGCRPPC